MLRPARNLLLSLFLVLSGCGPSAPLKPEKADRAGRPTAPVEEPPVARPVIQAGRGGDELLAAIALIKADNLRQAEANLEEIVKVRPDLAEAFFNLGWARSQLNKCREAIAPLQAGLKLKPADVAAINLVAICQRTLGQFTEAEKTYQQGLLLAPDNDKLHFNIGVLYELYLFKPELALEHYRRFQSLQKSPDNRVAAWITMLERKDGK